jgi:hypothetical protein
MQYDILPDIESKHHFDIEYILSVQRGSKLNIVPDFEGFSSISKQDQVYKRVFLERPEPSSMSYPISNPVLMPKYNF